MDGCWLGGGEAGDADGWERFDRSAAGGGGDSRGQGQVLMGMPAGSRIGQVSGDVSSVAAFSTSERVRRPRCHCRHKPASEPGREQNATAGRGRGGSRDESGIGQADAEMGRPGENVRAAAAAGRGEGGGLAEGCVGGRASAAGLPASGQWLGTRTSVRCGDSRGRETGWDEQRRRRKEDGSDGVRKRARLPGSAGDEIYGGGLLGSQLELALSPSYGPRLKVPPSLPAPPPCSLPPA